MNNRIIPEQHYLATICGEEYVVEAVCQSEGGEWYCYPANRPGPPLLIAADQLTPYPSNKNYSSKK